MPSSIFLLSFLAILFLFHAQPTDQSTNLIIKAAIVAAVEDGLNTTDTYLRKAYWEYIEKA
jgi:hypothetical protein